MSGTVRLAAGELAQRRRVLAAMAAGAAVFLFALAGTYQALGGAAELQATFGVDLPAFYGAFAGTRESVDLFRPQNYLALGFLHPLYLVVTVGVGITLGTAAIAGDVESGRAELVFAAPVARSAIYDARVGAWLAVQVAVVLAGTAGAVAGWFVSPDLRALGLAPLLRLTVAYLPLAILLGAVAFAVSAWSRTRGQALAVAIGATTLAYLVNFVGLLWEPLDGVRRISPFAWYVPVEAAGAVDPVPAGGLLVVAAALLLAGRWRTETRDLA